MGILGGVAGIAYINNKLPERRRRRENAVFKCLTIHFWFFKVIKWVLSIYNAMQSGMVFSI
jgi:hypothetical protein